MRPTAHSSVTPTRAIRAKRFRRGDPERIAAELWSTVHGFTTLALGGHLSHLEDPIVDVLAPLTTHLMIGLGDKPQRAAKSTADAIASPRG
jgi:Tetracyclin repressor-like, C-terminal domain